jgi:hypothetical protein
MWTIIIILFVLWLLGAFGTRYIPKAPRLGSWVHILVVVAAVLLILKLVNVI